MSGNQRQDVTGAWRRVTLSRSLDVHDTIERAAHSMMTRWENGISPELREEIMVEIYQPTLCLLLKAKRRP